ncbi:hypothetical protein FRC14_002708 [Serendipita sp. 396]|nr:hypothetical protein FRC14_002708 [Serendipita sp. 396]KAG8804286.1 hypothetical protein FRC16_010615 [Serendipita sp. 398]
MGPIGIARLVNATASVLESAAKVTRLVDRVLKKVAAKNNTLQNLRDALTCLRDDIELYQTLLSKADAAILSSRWGAVNQDTNALEEALDHSKLFLDFIMRTHTPEIGTLSEAELATYNHNVEFYRKENMKAFKLLWYNLYKHTFSAHQGEFAVSNQGAKLSNTLSTAFSLFKSNPFIVADSTIPLNVLNSNKDTIEQYEDMMRRTGKGWVEGRLSIKDAYSTMSSTDDIGVLRGVQISLFELLWTKALEQWQVPLESQTEIVSEPSPQVLELGLEPEPTPDQRAAHELNKLDRKLQTSISLANKQTFTTAFCGMAKAGKSSFLNALIGASILPSDEFPSTAWPCRIRHVEGQKEPELQYDQAPFLVALEKLRDWKYGAAMKQFEPPEFIDDDTPRDLVDGMNVWQWWMDLHPTSKDNLEQFESPHFQLEKSARGMEAVANLLFQLNDIVRIYQRYGPVFGVGTTDWPLLTLEFPSLSGQKMQGIFEFIDLPGMGEHLQRFENLVKTVAKRSDAVVPIVSLLNMQHDGSLQTLPGIINACDLECNAVICTNLDRVNSDNEERQNSLVTGAFWPNRSAPPQPGIIRCSALMGISAQTLLAMSQNELPVFETFWKPNVGYHAAYNILGKTGKKAYKRLEYDEWMEEIREQITESGLPDAIEASFEGIVKQARLRTTLQELRYVYRIVCNRTNDYSRILQGARRTKAEYDQAKERFKRDKESYNKLLDEWEADEATKIAKLRGKIGQLLKKVEEVANRSILKAFRQTLQNKGEWSRWWLPDQVKECSNEAWELDINGHSLEEFLRLSQQALSTSLNKLRIEVTPIIQKLQQDACKERGDDLITRIKKGTFEEDTLKQQIEQNIAYELPSAHSMAGVRRTQIKAIVEEGYGILPAIYLAIHSVLNRGSITSFSGYFTRTTIHTDTIMETYQKEIVVPWVQKMEKNDEKTVMGAVAVIAKSVFNQFLTAEEARFREELEQIAQPMDDVTLERKVKIYGNLVATKAALEEILRRTEARMPADRHQDVPIALQRSVSSI